MSDNKGLQQTSGQSKKFSVVMQSDGYKKLIAQTLQDPKRAQRFSAAVLSAVSTNPALQECEPSSILSSALLGESLNLSPSPQLGQYYLVPYKKKDKQGNVTSITAQFQIGYKGYIQLATRSGFYKKLNVLDIKEGELIRFDPLNEELEIDLIQDDDEREATPTIGYYAMFEYPNGFRKAIFWSKKKMLSHADKYSQAFSKVAYEQLQTGLIPEKDKWKYSSFWYKNFDEMAFKTMLRHLISRWGIMSIEMTEAYTKDMAENKQDGSYDYIDGAVLQDDVVISSETEVMNDKFADLKKKMDETQTIDELDELNESVKPLERGKVKEDYDRNMRRLEGKDA